jgi:4-diphosphocytidyl-2-C-methyl-D-erythritol kinase
LAWRVHLVKRIPVAAGLGGGSSDAATALRLANAKLVAPLPLDALHRLASQIGADVPFFLHDGAQLATGDGTDLRRVALPLDYAVLLVRPHGETKSSTSAIYARFDAARGATGFDERRARFVATLDEVAHAHDLAKLPANDLASSPLASRLRDLGAFRADVSGAGPTVYGLFEDEEGALLAGRLLDDVGQTWVVRPA